jgi:hypothetical protein
LAVVAALAAGLPATAAELDGVAMPETRQAAGEMLRLNGMGLRTYSIFNVHIYVAALYLQQPSQDADAILNSGQAKLLHIHFVHEASADHARQAWIDGFEQNCVAPCHLPEPEVARFLAAVPDFHRGDDSTLMWHRGELTISVNGRSLGTITDPTFARAILATFIGPHPPNDLLKRGLLAGGSATRSASNTLTR